ncbi:MAG: hypothetical protein HC866_00405 [Leptolyngbyaceae cyanobacterium RU_5_1]|nr:hypothetical protein [Leptolyngbyaceae cyanobacterium RU_5_1]
MDIWIENLFNDHRKRSIPGFLIRSTAPINVEDELSTMVDRDRPTIQTIIDCLYQNSKTGNDLGLVIAMHGYNTGFQEGGRDGVLEGWYQPLCTYVNDDPSIHKQLDSLVFLGYRWPSESLKRKGLSTEALKALPLLLGILLYGGLIISIACLVLSIITHSFITVLFAVLGIVPFSIILSLFLLRVSLYFRDSYRATQFGVPDLVELIRQLDHGLVQRKVRDALTDEVLYAKISSKIQDIQDLEKETLIQIIQTISYKLSKKPDLEIDPDDAKFQQFIKTLRYDIPLQLSDEVLIKIVERLVLVESMENDAAMRFWRQHSIKLSFIGHSMGAQVTTQVIRILSDIFDPRSVGAIGNNTSEKILLHGWAEFFG